MIGVVGSGGDLGSQLVERIRLAGLPTATYDPWVDTNTHDSPNAVFEASEITHWCAPLEALVKLDTKKCGQLVLHSSVMGLSYDAIVRSKTRLPNVGFNIVHCLMNEYGTVNTARGYMSPVVRTHLGSVGLRERVMTLAQHDRTAALTQGAAMLLCELLLDELRGINTKDLTPSGKWLLTLIEERAMHWTDATKHTVLQNPALREVFSSGRIEEVFNRYVQAES
jgi:hypothetical protein